MFIVKLLINAVVWLIVIDAVLSWIQQPNKMPRKFTHSITSKLYAPIHTVLSPQKTGGLDLSPIILILLLQWISSAIG
jgi:YggT family protein